MSLDATKVKFEQNQGFAITSPGEARAYSVTNIVDADTFLIEIEGKGSCQMPVGHPLFSAEYSGVAELDGVNVKVKKIPITATIPPEVVRTVAQGFGLTPAKLEDILANMGPGQKYDLLAQDAETRIAKAIDGGALTRFLRSAKGKVWFMNKRAAIENLMLKGAPLAVTMASLWGIGELVDMAGIKDPAVSFVLVVKGAEFVSLPIEVTMESLYHRMVLKRPFDLVFKEFMVRDAAGMVTGKLSAEVPVSFGRKMYFTLLNKIKPEGISYWAKGANVAIWPVRVLYGMGRGLILANLYDAFLEDHVKESMGGSIAEFGGFVAFFGIEIGDVLSGGYLSKKILSRTLIGIPLKGVASVVGAGFASFLLDSYIVAPLQYGKRRANHMITVSGRAAAEFTENEWLTRGLQSIMGEGVVGHLCSGRGVGLAYVVRDYIGVSLGLKSKYDTCAYVREAVEKEDISDMRGEAASLKVMLKNALIADGTDDPDIGVWKRRMDEGWFDWVDISPVQATNSRLFDVRIFQGLEMAKIYDTDEANKITSFLSEEFMEYENEGTEEEMEQGLARVPMNMTIIPDEKRGKFLNWLGGERHILSKRRKDLYAKLLWADIRRVAGFATDEDMKLLEFGKDAGFAGKYHKRFQADGEEMEIDEYDFPHSAEYYEALAEIVQKMAIESDVNLRKQLQAYSQQRYRMLLTAARNGDFKCTKAGDEGAMAVAPYVRDLQILDPVLIEPGNGLAAEAQESFLGEYADRLPHDTGFEHAMNEYAKRWEDHIKTKLGESIAVRKALGARYTGHCNMDPQCADSAYAETEFSSLAYLAEEGLGVENRLGMSLSDGAIDRSLIGMPALIRAFYNYATLGSKAPEAIAKGVIGEEGRLLDKDRFASWVARPARLAYEALTGSAAFAPEDKKMWEAGAVESLQAKLDNVRFLLARKWLMAIGERAEDTSREMMELLDEYINRPQNTEIRRDMKVIAAYAKGLRKSGSKDAEKFLELVDTGIITSDGRLGEFSAVEMWIKDEVIELAGKLIKETGQDDADKEQMMDAIKKELEALKAEYSKEMAKYQKLVKEKKSDLDLAIKLIAMESAIMKYTGILQGLTLEKMQMDALKAELAHLKAL